MNWKPMPYEALDLVMKSAEDDRLPRAGEIKDLAVIGAAALLCEHWAAAFECARCPARRYCRDIAAHPRRCSDFGAYRGLWCNLYKEATE